VRAEHPLIVALVEAWAHRAGLPAPTVWAWIDRREAPAPEARAAIVDAFYPLVRPDSFLPSPDDNGTLRTMRATAIETPRRGRPTEVDHPLFAALAAHGVTLAEEAKIVRRSPASIRSFCYPKNNDNRRPVPDALKQRWLSEYGVPLKTWR